MTSQRTFRLEAAARPVAFAIVLLLSVVAADGPAPAQESTDDEIDRLMERLAEPEQDGWQQIEDRIALEWSKSGSPAMDLLLQRGRDAMEEGDVEAALEHFTALTDHAPDFAEGWNALATAHYREEHFGLALDAIARALTLEPRHFGAMIGLGTILHGIGQEAEALKVFRMVHEIHPHRPNVNDWIERLSARLDGETL